MKRILGVTGGVGCGKSTVLSILKEHYDAEIFMADDVGHEVFEKSTACYIDIVSHFGERIMDDDGNIRRDALADIIFNDVHEKEFLDDIVHPYVMKRIKESIAAWKERIDEIDKFDSGLHLFVLETALMFESGADKFCDELWGIFTEEDQRIDRLVTTRGYSEEKARSIFSAQLSESYLRRYCNRVILNNSSKSELEEMVCWMVTNMADFY